MSDPKPERGTIMLTMEEKEAARVIAFRQGITESDLYRALLQPARLVEAAKRTTDVRTPDGSV